MFLFCYREAHIIMETLFSAFHRQYAHLQSVYRNNPDPRERHAEMIRLEADTQAPTPFLPDNFTSQLNRPQFINASHRQQQPRHSKSTHLRSPHSPEEQQKRATRRLSNIYMHTTRRLSSVFSSSATSLPTSDEKLFTWSPRRFSEPRLSLMDDKGSTRIPLLMEEYYRVPDAYKSNHNSMVSLYDGRYNSNNSSSLGVYDRFVAHGDKSTSSASTTSISSRCEDSAYASGTSTPILAPIDADVYIPESIQSASTWQYSPLAHKYAIKAVEEMERVAKCKSPPTSTSLSVEWPKAWSYPLAF